MSSKKTKSAPEVEAPGALATYCVRCREPTNSENSKRMTSANGRSYLSSTCSVCGGKKSKFIQIVP